MKLHESGCSCGDKESGVEDEYVFPVLVIERDGDQGGEKTDSNEFPEENGWSPQNLVNTPGNWVEHDIKHVQLTKVYRDNQPVEQWNEQRVFQLAQSLVCVHVVDSERHPHEIDTSG